MILIMEIKMPHGKLLLRILTSLTKSLTKHAMSPSIKLSSNLLTWLNRINVPQWRMRQTCWNHSTFWHVSPLLTYHFHHFIPPRSLPCKCIGWPKNLSKKGSGTWSENKRMWEVCGFCWWTQNNHQAKSGKVCIEELEEKIMGYVNKTVQQMIAHLCGHGGKAITYDKEVMFEEHDHPWTPVEHTVSILIKLNEQLSS